MHTERELLEAIRSIPVIDTHEHLEGEANQPSINCLHDYTRHYFVCDLISAGLDPAVIRRLSEPDVDIMTKWNWLAPYWERCRYTGYGQTLDLAVQRLYGVERIEESTIQQIEVGFQNLRASSGYSRYIMKDVCGIEHVMNNIWHLNGDSEGGFYWFVTDPGCWIAPEKKTVDEVISRGVDIRNLSDWVKYALKSVEEDFTIRGAKALKLAIAYARTLHFEETSYQQAQAGFDKLMAGETCFAELKPMQDYVAHQIFQWANDRKMVLQIHTGYQEGNGNILAWSDPSNLNEVILRYPGIRFDLFHMGYPYQHVIGAMGKMFPNVYLNLCWAHMLSPIATRRALGEWLQLVPLNKIFAFGGDCLFFDGVVGHLELARRNVASVLAEQVEVGLFNRKTAEQTARMIFYENPKTFYGMDD